MSQRDCRGKTPITRSQAKCFRSPTCQGCLLHPPPLVDLARDLTISGFFLIFFGGSLDIPDGQPTQNHACARILIACFRCNVRRGGIVTGTADNVVLSLCMGLQWTYLRSQNHSPGFTYAWSPSWWAASL